MYVYAQHFGPCKKYNTSYAIYFVVVGCLAAAVDVFFGCEWKEKGRLCSYDLALASHLLYRIGYIFFVCISCSAISINVQCTDDV